MSVMLSHLLSVGFFTDQVVFATERALSTLVSSVTAAPGASAVAEVSPFALVVFGRSHLRAEDVSTDLAIRLAAQRQAAGLVLQRPPSPLSLATRSLAEKSGVALVLVDHAQPDQLVPAMDRFVRDPEVGDGGMLSVVAHRLRSVGADPDEMVRVLARTLRHPVGLVDPAGRVLAGDLPAEALLGVDGATARLSAARPAPWVRSAGEDDLLVAQPVQLTAGGPANLWLVALVPVSPAARVRAATQALGVATWAFVAYLATTAVRLERQSKQHEALLTRLLDEAESPRRPVVEQATAVGWRLGGWHTAIHVMARRGSAAAAMRDRLHECLLAHGLPADPITHGDGWSLWTTTESPPDVAAEAELLRSVHRALLDAERDYPGLRLCAGVGTADEGTLGLRRSLGEAHQAGLLASARNTAGAVEHIGTDNVKRLLANRYVTSLQHDLAHQLLRPLTVADASGQLVHTLSCYLDNESSATAAAAVLGVHRNTVLQRLDRIRSLLTVEFNDADERLALHLATRLVQSGPPQRATRPDEDSVAPQV
ncbi:PucR family transcriptional regulator [Actinokineospora sp.]|uniref:PucR family transcriptional regulator n=1 Tax=Actinokineospora sp. TaxID=1872133 RepID=UPI0040379BFE